MDKLKHLIVLLVLINTQFTSAQQNITLDETIFLHSNATTLLTGENLLYKVYCLKSSDKTPSIISKVAYVELIDETKKTIFKTKISLENSSGQGDYFIPTTLKSGNYKLIAYTNWMLNKPISEFFQVDLNIINPYKTGDKKDLENNFYTNNSNSNITSSQNNVNSEIITSENVKLQLNKKNFTNRELVDLKVITANTIFENGNYSLSIRKTDNLPTKNQSSAVDFAKKNTTTILDLQNQEIIIPELRGEIVSGKITSKNNLDRLDNIIIAFSLPGKSFTFKTVKTDKNGNFIFNINNTFFATDITVQIIDEKASNYNIQLDNSPEIDRSKLTFQPNSNLSYTTKESLLNRSISSQIENAYYHKKLDNIAKSTTADPFYFPVAKEYLLDDYTRFKTLKETITEVATEVYTKQKNGDTFLHVNDPSIFPQLPELPLVLIDGLYLENQNELLNYNMKNVYKIEVIVGRYYIGPKSFNGLVSFTTFDKDFKSTQNGSSIIKTTILRPQPKKIYNRIDYTNPIDYESIPDFRNQLFWNPDVKLNNDSNNTFYTSDVSGTFEIKLEGFAKNGTPISLKETFEVKDSSAN